MSEIKANKLGLALLSVFVYLAVCFIIALTFPARHITIPGTEKQYEIHLGDTLSVEIKEGDYSADKNYLLYLSDTALTGIKPEVMHVDQKYVLAFKLLRNSDSEKPWSAIFRQLKWWSPEPVKACVGPDDQSRTVICVTNNANNVTFQAMSKERLVIWAIFTVITLCFFLRAITSENSTMLRDWQPIGADPNKKFTTAAAYSLGRAQMAFWFILVVLAFLLIWLVTGDTPAFNTSTLALIGIGSGTALGAAVIDDSNNQPALESEGFLKDLLTNANGYGFHRVQMLIWTIVLGVTFVTSVMTSLTMPNFDGTLLALMGISSGTYLGFKLPEQKGAPSK